ncbi:MAG: transporter substrate-binding domain-containing protein [Propionibacteriaceae bacterium]|nr:transporter substrate-binding domain-containing protein [Propionibacteriaceae bacterium]
MTKLFLKAIAAATAALVLTACAGAPAAVPTDGLTTVNPGKLTTCSDIPYPPFEMEDPTAPTGYSGFDIEIVGAIAEKLNLELAVIKVDFDALQSGIVLAAGDCDLGTSAMTITDERKANIDFADPYYDSLQSLLVRKDSGITSLAQLEGKIIGVQQGTTGLSYATEHAPATATLTHFPSDGELWPAMVSNGIDAILQDYPVNFQHQKDDPNFVVVEKYETDEQYGFAFAKGKNDALREAVNAGLAAIRADGTYDRLYQKYFG